MSAAGTQGRARGLCKQRINEGDGCRTRRSLMEYPRVRQYAEHTAEHEFEQADPIPARQSFGQPPPAACVMDCVLAECAHQNIDVRTLHS